VRPVDIVWWLFHGKSLYGAKFGVLGASVLKCAAQLVKCLLPRSEFKLGLTCNSQAFMVPLNDIVHHYIYTI